MYCKENLFQRVKGHIKESELKLLESLIDDLDNFNKSDCNKFVELYIDFDNVGNDSEFDPYETFSIKVHIKNEKLADKFKATPVVVSELSLKELDVACASIEGYFDELNPILKGLSDILEKDNKVLTDEIHELEKDNRLVYQDMDGIKAARIEDFTKQFLDGQLYDINRLPEVIYTLQNEDKSKFDRAWINDIALIKLLKYYYNKCGELEGKLKVAEDNAIMNQIMK